MEKKIDIAIVGAGPAGLSAGIEAAKEGAKVLIIDENEKPGGQLFKQIHRFFGSKEHYAGVRGFEIGNRLLKECEDSGVEIMLNSVVWGIFPGYTVGVVKNNKENLTVKAKRIILATGAYENPLSFPGWTLPGVMGAGASQTMMNIHRVLPGKSALMIGSGNVGLIVSYQLIQAGCDVKAVIEILPKVGGYIVHADKISRLGVKILISHTILEARGKDKVEEAVVCEVDKNFNPLYKKQKRFKVDLICIATGLSPLAELAWMIGCQFEYSPKLGGYVPLHNKDMETTQHSIYIAGDTSGIEEASTAIEEGRLAGISCIESLGFLSPSSAKARKGKIDRGLKMLRIGPFGDFRQDEKEKIYSEFKKAKRKAHSSN